MQHSAISQLEAYWQGLRNGRVVPSRSDIDPRGIEQALEFAFILERIAPGMARFRLAGMHLNDLMGMEVRGMPITTFFAPDTRQQINDALEHVFETPAIARFSLIAERGLGKPQSSAELIILPLRSDLGDISRALGCLVCHGEIGRTPRRFTISELHLEPLEAGVVVGGPPSGRRASDHPATLGAAQPPRQPAARLCRGSHPDIPGAARRDAGAAESDAGKTPPQRPGPKDRATDQDAEGASDPSDVDSSDMERDDMERDDKPGKPTRVPWLRLVNTDD